MSIVKVYKLISCWCSYDSRTDNFVPIASKFIIMTLKNWEPIQSNVELKIDQKDDYSSIDELHNEHLSHA